MAQTIKLRRSSTQGNVPTTTQLSLGEVALNTYDGRAFIKKDVSGTETIEHIITTNSYTTGSILLSGSVLMTGSIVFPDITEISGGTQIISTGRLNIASSAGTTLTGSNITAAANSVHLTTTNNDLRFFGVPLDTGGNVDYILGIDAVTDQVYLTASAAGGGTTLTGLNGQLIYFNGDDNPESTAELTLSSQGKFQIGIDSPPAATTTNNPWNNPGFEATGSTIVSDNEALITNARYTGRRFNILGLAEHGDGGGVVGSVLPINGLPTAYDAPVASILPPPIDLDDYSMGINGQLRLGNAWGWVNPDGKTDIITYGSFVSVPGSPGLKVGDGGFRLFTSESMIFDYSGSLLTPNESASVEFTLTSDVDPSLAIKVRNPEKNGLFTALYVSQSDGLPRIGIGTSKPDSAFDIKEVKDDGTGTEFVLKTARSTQGAQIGDKAGTLNFTVDSGSFADYKTSGSAAVIECEVTGIDPAGVKGDLVLKASNLTKSAPAEVLRINQSTSTFKSALKTEQSLIIGTNSVSITNIEDTFISGDLSIIDLWVTQSYNGAIYDYTLSKSGTGARAGQFMVMAYDGNISYTDTSVRPIGSGTPPEIIAELSGEDVYVKLVSGSGYEFRSLRKLI